MLGKCSSGLQWKDFLNKKNNWIEFKSGSCDPRGVNGTRNHNSFFFFKNLIEFTKPVQMNRLIFFQQSSFFLFFIKRNYDVLNSEKSLINKTHASSRPGAESHSTLYTVAYAQLIDLLHKINLNWFMNCGPSNYFVVFTAFLIKFRLKF